MPSKHCNTLLSSISHKCPTKTTSLPFIPCRNHSTSHQRHRSPRPIPPPRPIVPDVKTFLSLFGRGLSQFEKIFPTWAELFSKSPQQLKDDGLGPTRLRRYFLAMRENYRQDFWPGKLGAGADFDYVHQEKGWLQVVSAPTTMPRFIKSDDEKRIFVARLAYKNLMPALVSPNARQIVVNVPHDASQPPTPPSEWKPADKYKWDGRARMIIGPRVRIAPNHNGRRAYLSVEEGLWARPEPNKLDGGERRRAEVRAKKRAQENKMKRT